MAEQGQADAERGSSTVADEYTHRDELRARLSDRQSRAGRLAFITFSVNTQRALAKLSADVQREYFNIVDSYGEHIFTEEQRTKILSAREEMLEAGFALHSVASELLGELKKEGT